MDSPRPIDPVLPLRARSVALALGAFVAWAAIGAVDASVARPADSAKPLRQQEVRKARDGGEPGRRVVIRRGIRYAGREGRALDVYHRARATSLPIVLVVHGGGWAHGSRRKTTGISLALARAGFAAVNLDYTLAAPGRPGLPTQLRELRAATRWARRNARSFGADPARIGALGTSAGGHLVALLATRAGGERARIGAAVTWSAPLDLVALARHFMLGPAIGTLVGCGIGPCAQQWRTASPAAHASGDDPPMLIVNSHRELVPRSQAEQMAGRLAAAGAPARLRLLEGSAHATQYSPTAIGPSISFLRRQLR